MDNTLIRAIAKIWSKETIKHAAGRDEGKAHRPKTSNMERVWEEIASPEQIAWLKNITEGGARMLWDGRMHRDFVSGMRRFGASNGKAQKTAKEGKAKESKEKPTNHGLAQETGRGGRKTGRGDDKKKARKSREKKKNRRKKRKRGGEKANATSQNGGPQKGTSVNPFSSEN